MQCAQRSTVLRTPPYLHRTTFPMNQRSYLRLGVVVAGVLLLLTVVAIPLSSSKRHASAEPESVRNEAPAADTGGARASMQTAETGGQHRQTLETPSASLDSKLNDSVAEKIRALLNDPLKLAEAMNTTIPAWVQADPRAAVKFMEELPPGVARDSLRNRIAQLWAAQDPAAALAWAKQLPDAGERSQILGLVFVQMAQTDPHQAAEEARNLDLGTSNSGMFQAIVAQWSAKDPASAEQWVRALSVGEQRDLLMERVAFAESKSDPSSAARLVLDQIPAGNVQDEAVMAVLHQWALRDFNGASAWVASFPQTLGILPRAKAELDGIAQYGLGGS